MDNPVLKTSADELYELVRSKKKISVEETAKILKIPDKVVQSLVDFLVEEKIFGIEYKFTTPYIYISQEKNADFQIAPQKKFVTRDEFFQNANKWHISPEKINELWKKYVKEHIDSIKEEFYTKSNSRKIPKEDIDRLWKKYLGHLLQNGYR